VNRNFVSEFENVFFKPKTNLNLSLPGEASPADCGVGDVFLGKRKIFCFFGFDIIFWIALSLFFHVGSKWIV
jgi:hypothetical protein